jgi:two-component system phosphate regulon response regulator PhoB
VTPQELPENRAVGDILPDSDDDHALSPATPGADRILVVDDEPDIVALCAYHLAKAGYRVVTSANGSDALEQARGQRPALIVLDLMLPRMAGYDVLRHIRADDTLKQIPVLMLTARREEADRIQGLPPGADDYLTKPFSPQELVLRVGAILRRVGSSGAGGQDVLRIGPIVIDRGEHKVTIDDQEIELTPTEFKLLLTLVERRGRVQSRSHLLETVWDAAPDMQTRTVDMHVQRLRGKLGVAGELVETVRGFGYRIRAGSSRGQ